MISCLAGMIALDNKLVYFPLLCLAFAFFIWYARTRGSFYFLIVSVLYGYIGLTYMLFSSAPGLDFQVYLVYFFLSCAGMIVFLVNYKKILHTQSK
ncbi:MAG: hypothetical protein IPJ82_12745 [Lewinellaceae bacterium]|nr:hypothetical protein [Lewinellaceae bacterium]